MESSSQPAKEKKGLSKWWTRVKAAFKDKEITAASTSSTAQTPAVAATKPTEPSTTTTTAAAPATTTEPSEPPMQTDIDRRLARARELFKKYDFEFDESEWKVHESKRAKPTERVQKQIRMRVKYTCHSCSTVFGHDKVCISCQHPRCKDCTRYPPRKPKGKKKSAAAAAAPTDETASKCTCHECQTGVDIGTAECPNCKHKICDQCLKEAMVAVSPPPTTTGPEKKQATPEEPVAAPATNTVS